MNLKSIGQALGQISPRLQPRSVTREMLLTALGQQLKNSLPGAIEAIEEGASKHPLQLTITEGRLLGHLIGARPGRDPRSKPVPAHRLQADVETLGTLLAGRHHKGLSHDVLLDVSMPLSGLHDLEKSRWVWDGNLEVRDRAKVTEQATASLRASLTENLRSSLTGMTSRRIGDIQVSGGITYGYRELPIRPEWGRLAMAHPELVGEAVQPLITGPRSVLQQLARETGDLDKISSSALTFKYPVQVRGKPEADSPFILPFYWELPTDSPLIDVLMDSYRSGRRTDD